MTHYCPACRGERYNYDPRGVLAFGHRHSCMLNESEDLSQVADNDVLLFEPTRTRRATQAELVLLRSLGYDPPQLLDTVATRVTAGVRRRSWPTLGID